MCTMKDKPSEAKSSERKPSEQAWIEPIPATMEELADAMFRVPVERVEAAKRRDGRIR